MSFHKTYRQSYSTNPKKSVDSKFLPAYICIPVKRGGDTVMKKKAAKKKKKTTKRK